MEYAHELGLGLKLIGTAERIDGKLAVRVHPAFLYSGHPLASVHGPFNAVTVESEAITEITMSGPGAGGPQTASAVLGDVISAMIPPASTPETTQALEIIDDVESSFYLHMEVADRPGVLAQVALVLGEHGASIKSVVQKGLGEKARLVMVVHPVLESQFFAAVEEIAGAGLPALAAARDPGHRRGVRLDRQAGRRRLRRRRSRPRCRRASRKIALRTPLAYVSTLARARGPSVDLGQLCVEIVDERPSPIPVRRGRRPARRRPTRRRRASTPPPCACGRNEGSPSSRSYRCGPRRTRRPAAPAKTRGGMTRAYAPPDAA